MSNQFKLSLKKPITVYQYRFDIMPMTVFDPTVIQRVLRLKRKILDSAFGLYVHSGQSIYSTNELDESLKFPVQLKDVTYQVKIDTSTQTLVTLDRDGGFENADNYVGQQLLNIIVKEAFQQTGNLKQIGRSPRFFDIQNAMKLPKLNVWSGFKASAINTNVGLTLVIDSIFKFMSTETCLQRIDALRKATKGDESRFRSRVLLEFCQKSIIADWSHKRTYIVHDVDFESNPISQTFEHGGDKVTVADYFKQQH